MIRGNEHSRKVDDLISQVDSVLKTMNEETAQRLWASTELYVTKTFGSDHVLTKRFKKLDKWSSISNFRSLRGLLLAIKDNFEDEYKFTKDTGDLSRKLIDFFYQNPIYNLEAIRNIILNDSDYFHYEVTDAERIFKRFIERGIIAYSGNGQAYVITNEGKKFHNTLTHSKESHANVSTKNMVKMTNPAFNSWDVFLCHSSKDKNIIRSITKDFDGRGISYWFDEDQIRTGDNIIDKISIGLQRSRHIIPFISEHQIQSGWARNEYQAILSKIISEDTSQKILPLVLDSTPHEKIPIFLSNFRYERYSLPEEYERLLAYLENENKLYNPGQEG